MEPKHVVCKEKLPLEFECNEIEEERLHLSKNTISGETTLDPPKDDVHKMKSQPHIKDWSSLTWTCYHCRNTFNGYTLLKTHLETEHQEIYLESDYYQCSDCDECSASYSSFINHVRSVHHEALKFCCDACNQIIPNYAQLSVHRDEHNEVLSSDYPTLYHCSQCRNAYSSEKKLKNHIQLSHNAVCSEEIDEVLISIFGEESTKTSQQSSSEVTECVVNSIQCKEEYTETEPVYQCGKCVKSFPNEIDLKEHMRSHTGFHPFQCEICFKILSKRYALKEHMRLHTGELPYKCDYCDQRFRIKECKMTHMLRHTGERPFKCDICSKSYLKRHHLNDHLRVHSEERLFQCEVCEKSFKSEKEKKAHKLIHTDERPFQCEICEKRFKTNKEKKTHLHIHTDERPFQCEFCGKRFKSNQLKKSHLRVHSTDPPVQCEICERHFKTDGNKRYHIRTFHCSDRRYGCKMCSKTFKTIAIMKAHKLIHTDERPFQCDFCEKRFKTIKEKKSHLRVHSNNPPVQCEICLRFFKSNENKKYHIRTIHCSDHRYDCKACSKSFKTLSILRRHNCKACLQVNTEESYTNTFIN